VKLSSASICAPKLIWAKKSEKVNHTTPKEKKKKVREIRRVLSLSLSLSFSASVTRARAIALWSLFSALLCFLLSSHQNNAGKN
jgi:hypothetical protein